MKTRSRKPYVKNLRLAAPMGLVGVPPKPAAANCVAEVQKDEK